ncbi:MAG: pyrimidine 5'-nucleotidase [Neisseria sp.]|nr:pyrimidine 5'-nucleotidase [Neisseria sp.]
MTAPVWLFDLDNTLHRADAGIFQLINREMTAYLAEHLALSLQAASDLRQHYWHEYGATLAGLQKHHPHIDIEDFLRASHPSAAVNAALVAEIALPDSLRRIIGTRAVFSNGPSFYVNGILEELHIASLFSATFGCNDFGLRYKPHPEAYLSVCAQLNVSPEQCIMVDDSADNLHAAKQLGMCTVWFGQAVHALPFVDLAVADMAQLAREQDGLC